MKTVTIVLAEDHAIVREGLRTLLELNPAFKVIGECSNGRQAVGMAADLRPAVVVMDIAMPTLNGFEATRQILGIAPGTRVLVLSAHSDDEYVTRMAQVGAYGYVAKQNSGQVLARAITEIANGRPYFSAAILKRVRDAEARARELGEPRGIQRRKLTAREAEVLQLVAEGFANKQIASELDISIKTVEKHRQQLMDKLGIHDTAGLTRHAIAAGVIECGVHIKSG